MKLIKLTYLLIFLIIATMLLSSCLQRTRIRPPNLTQVLKNHKILNLRRTRVEHVAMPNDVTVDLYLRNVEFTRDDLIAIRDSMSLYLQSDEFIAFVETKNNIIRFHYDDSLRFAIIVQDRRSNFVVLFKGEHINKLMDNAIQFSIEDDTGGTVHYSYGRTELYIDGEYVWSTRFYIDLE